MMETQLEEESYYNTEKLTPKIAAKIYDAVHKHGWTWKTASSWQNIRHQLCKERVLDIISEKKRTQT